MIGKGFVAIPLEEGTIVALERPYSDPGLVRSRRKYARFVVRLAKRGMLQFAEGGPVIVSCFFGRKSIGYQRIIFDTRLVNTAWGQL